MDIKKQMETIYNELSPDKIPWNLETPPELLVEIVGSGWIQPCAAVDLGCGAGNYAVWLASKGYRVTGIDVSPTAVGLAGRLAGKKGLNCQFVAKDLLGNVGELTSSFDFAYDWEVLHHIFPEYRKTYVRNVHHMLKPDGKYLSVCFSEDDSDFGGEGKYRKTPLGTELYFSSEDELKKLFEPFFDIYKLFTAEIAGKYGSHKVVVAQMVRTNN